MRPLGQSCLPLNALIGERHQYLTHQHIESSYLRNPLCDHRQYMYYQQIQAVALQESETHDWNTQSAFTSMLGHWGSHVEKPMRCRHLGEKYILSWCINIITTYTNTPRILPLRREYKLRYNAIFLSSKLHTWLNIYSNYRNHIGVHYKPRFRRCW